MSNKIGDRIRERRLKMGFTQEEVASRLGINRVSYSMYETNKNIPPSDKLSQLVDILNTNADYLLFKTDDPSPVGVQLRFDFSKPDENTTPISYESKSESLQNLSRITRWQVNNLMDKIESNGEFDFFEKEIIEDALNEMLENQHNNKITVPLVGTICAGDGLLAHENIEGYVVYPVINPQKAPNFALKVKGKSMINAGIEDGDIVFFKQSPWAEYNGQIVAVIINDEEGTLKRMKWSEGSPKIKLIPENDDYETFEVFPNEIHVCGVYMGHFRPDKNKII